MKNMIDKGRESEEEEEMEKGRKSGGSVAKRKRGGRMEHEGHMAKKRHDRHTGGAVSRPGRKSGGGVGADKRPLTGANKASEAEGHMTDGTEHTVE